MAKIDTSSFIGLSKTSGQDLAEAKNLIFRLIRVDGKDFFAYPEDHREDRVCVEIDYGRITKAVLR